MNLGKVTREQGGFQVVFDRVIQHPMEKVWEAITDTALLKHWFTDIEMDFRPGGKITFRFRDKDRSVTHGEIVKIDPPHLFVYTWEGELATWALSPEGKNKCRLKLTYQKLAEDHAANAPAGFHILLDRLEDALSGNTRYYPFGTEENDPHNKKLQAMYGRELSSRYPDMESVKPIVVEKLINAPREKIWDALTKKELMKQWYFNLDDFKAEPGFVFKFPGQGHKGEQYIHRCEILEVIPWNKLQYTWQYENYPGYSLVTFELIPQGNQTLVKLTHMGIETFPKNNPDFAKNSFNGSWTELITSLLPKFVEH